MLGYSQFQFVVLSEHRGVKRCSLICGRRTRKTKWEGVEAEREYDRSDLSDFKILSTLSNNWVPSQFSPATSFRVTDEASLKQTPKVILERVHFGWQYGKSIWKCVFLHPAQFSKTSAIGFASSGNSSPIQRMWEVPPHHTVKTWPCWAETYCFGEFQPKKPKSIIIMFQGHKGSAWRPDNCRNKCHALWRWLVGLKGAIL